MLPGAFIGQQNNLLDDLISHLLERGKYEDFWSDKRLILSALACLVGLLLRASDHLRVINNFCHSHSSTIIALLCIIVRFIGFAFLFLVLFLNFENIIESDSSALLFIFLLLNFLIIPGNH